MSRVGKNPVALPQGVTANLAGQDLKVKGPKGELALSVHSNIEVKLDGSVITVALIW
jgi:large subunit ribosomal protein L6